MGANVTTAVLHFWNVREEAGGGRVLICAVYWCVFGRILLLC